MRQFKRVSQSFLLGSMLIMGASFAAANTEVKVGQMIAGGPGCEDSQVGIYPQADKGLTLFYRDFLVQMPADKPFARSQCSVQISYDYAGERQFAVKSARIYFSNKVETNKGKVLFNVMNIDPVNGSSTLVNDETDLERKGYQSLAIVNKDSDLVWSPCQSDTTRLQYKAEVRMNEGESVKVRHAFLNLVSKPC